MDPLEQSQSIDSITVDNMDFDNDDGIYKINSLQPGNRLEEDTRTMGSRVQSQKLKNWLYTFDSEDRTPIAYNQPKSSNSECSGRLRVNAEQGIISDSMCGKHDDPYTCDCKHKHSLREFLIVSDSNAVQEDSKLSKLKRALSASSRKLPVSSPSSPRCYTLGLENIKEDVRLERNGSNVLRRSTMGLSKLLAHGSR